MNKGLKVKYNEIKSCVLFADVPTKTVKRISTYPIAQKMSANTTVIKEGDVGDSMFIILSGTVDVFKTNKMIKVATLGAGTFIGEGALVSGAPRNATIKIATDAKLAFFNIKAFNKLITSHPSISTVLMKTHTERCKSVVKNNSNIFAKSKKVISVFAILGGILFLKYGGDVFGIKALVDIGSKIPNEIMALFGPVTGAVMLKFQKMFVGDIVSKIESI